MNKATSKLKIVSGVVLVISILGIVYFNFQRFSHTHVPSNARPVITSESEITNEWVYWYKEGRHSANSFRFSYFCKIVINEHLVDQFWADNSLTDIPKADFGDASRFSEIQSWWTPNVAANAMKIGMGTKALTEIAQYEDGHVYYMHFGVSN